MGVIDLLKCVVLMMCVVIEGPSIFAEVYDEFRDLL